MTTYIRRSYPAKKLSILGKRENEIMHAIFSGVSLDRLLKVAEKVRTAHLAVLKGKRHYVVDDGHPHLDDFREIDAKIADWTLKSTEEIIKYYRDNPKDSYIKPAPFAST